MSSRSADFDVDRILAGAREAGRSTGRNRPGPLDRPHRRTGLVAITLNLTPMIDVVFLLLLFFLTASRFGSNEGMLPANLPARSAAVSTEIPRTPIRVRFVAQPNQPDRCNVTIERFNEAPLPLAELGPSLRKIQEQPGFDVDTPVHLMAGNDIRWDHVVNAYNAALAAGYAKVYFAATR